MFKRQVKCSECGFLALSGAEDVLTGSVRDRLDQLQLFKEAGMVGLLEIKQKARDKLRNEDTNPVELNCSRYVWSRYDIRNMPHNQALDFIRSQRLCPYYFEYIPGFMPREHLELQRERTQRRFLIMVSILSAAVGAAIATLVNLIWS